MKQYVFIFMTVFFLCIACSKYVEVDKPSNELIAEGVALMDSKKYEKAAKKFENAILNAETPEEAQHAQRMLGDAYFMRKNYLDAIAAYEVYYDIYYQSPFAPYILNRLGLSCSELSLHPKRDQTFALKSVDYFDQLEALYPEEFEEYGAGDNRYKMYLKLSEYEYQVGRYYMRTGKPESAILRFKYLQNNYPATPRLEDSHRLMVESALRLNDGRFAAAQYLQEFTDSYPSSKHLKGLAKKVEKKLKK